MVHGRRPPTRPLFSCCWLTTQEANSGEWLPLLLLCLLPWIICSYCLHFLRQFKVVAMGIRLFQKASLPTSSQGCFFLLKLWLNSTTHKTHPNSSSTLAPHPAIWNMFSFMACHYLAFLCIFLLVLWISSTRPQVPTNADHHSCLYLSGLAPPELHNTFNFQWYGPVNT